jgi:hypothetical protein
MNVSQATQKLNNKGQPVKTARCPLPSHIDRFGRGVQSSFYLGEQKDFEGKRFWSFSCHHGGKPYHVFQALPDPAAPRNTEEYVAWVERQKEGSKPVGLA